VKKTGFNRADGKKNTLQNQGWSFENKGLTAVEKTCEKNSPENAFRLRR